MSRLTPTITLEFDLTNPGQFLACCGLLELASRMDGEALAWFSDGQFHLSTKEPRLLTNLLDGEVRPVRVNSSVDEAEESPSPPIVLTAFDLVLDWWMDDSATRAGFKTWSGGQTVMGFVDGMRVHLRAFDGAERELLKATIAASKPKPFYFDSRLSRLTALDMGFSTERFTPTYSPGVELLALVGLQRFRPYEIVQREYYGYHVWSTPLPVTIAAPTAYGLVGALSTANVRFPLVIRTGGKYKAFGSGTLEKETS